MPYLTERLGNVKEHFVAELLFFETLCDFINYPTNLSGCRVAFTETKVMVGQQCREFFLIVVAQTLNLLSKSRRLIGRQDVGS